MLHLIHRVHTTFSEKLTKIKVKKHFFFLTTWIHQNLTERPVFRVQRRMAKRLTAEWTRTQFKCQTYCKVTLWRQQHKHIWTHISSHLLLLLLTPSHRAKKRSLSFIMQGLSKHRTIPLIKTIFKSGCTDFSNARKYRNVA